MEEWVTMTWVSGSDDCVAGDATSQEDVRSKAGGDLIWFGVGNVDGGPNVKGLRVSWGLHA